MPVAQPKLTDIARLIQSGQETWEERWKDLKEDFEAKHQENRERRHAQQNQIGNVEGRLTLVEGRTAVLETKVVSIVGDGSGGSGLLNEIDHKVDALQGEFAGIKKVLAFLAFVIMAAIGVLAIFYKH